MKEERDWVFFRAGGKLFQSTGAADLKECTVASLAGIVMIARDRETIETVMID